VVREREREESTRPTKIYGSRKTTKNKKHKLAVSCDKVDEDDDTAA